MSDLSQMEPAERDPAQLRRTGITLLVIILIGGVVVATAYLLKLRADAKSGRPPILERLVINFGARDQDNKAFAIFQLKDKVTLLTPVALSEREHSAEPLRAMVAISRQFAGDDRLRFVVATVDPDRDGLPELKALRADLGVADDPRWSFIQAEKDNIRNYLKDKLRLGQVRETTVDGEAQIEYLALIDVIDRHLHLRQQYDLNRSLAVQEDARRLLTENPEQARKLKAAEHTDDVKATEEHIVRTINFLLNEELQD